MKVVKGQTWHKTSEQIVQRFSNYLVCVCFSDLFMCLLYSHSVCVCQFITWNIFLNYMGRLCTYLCIRYPLW